MDEVVRRAMTAGLVKGEGFAVDAGVIKADASGQRGVPGTEGVDCSDPKLSTRAVREYLPALEAEAFAETPPKNRSLTDPLAQWTAAPGGPAFYAYATNSVIDTAWGIILDAEATPAHCTAEVEVTKANTTIYRARQGDCQACPLTSQCCPNAPFGRIARSIHEAARDVAPAIAKTPEYRQSRC
jgi:hypothetical protein